jgi:hypothetical protein
MLNPSDKPSAEEARRFFETHFVDYWQGRYEAYLADQEDEPELFPGFAYPRQELDQCPRAVRDAFDFYLQEIEIDDWGSVRVFRIPEPNFWLVCVSTDGDDGWVELFDDDGAPLGAARTYLELLAWEETETIRQQVFSGELPPDLIQRQDQSLWGK